MSRRGTGMAFVAIAAFLYVGRLLAAAVFGSGVQSWNAELFESMLDYVGSTPASLAGVSLVLGIGYLIWAELDGTGR